MTAKIGRPHEVRLVWNRDVDTFNFWCMSCSRTGTPFLDVTRAVEDGERHAESWTK